MGRRQQKDLETGFQSACLRASGYQLRDPAQKCQMYYIVKDCNVNTALCHKAGWSVSYLRRTGDPEEQSRPLAVCPPSTVVPLELGAAQSRFGSTKPRYINTLEGHKQRPVLKRHREATCLSYRVLEMWLSSTALASLPQTLSSSPTAAKTNKQRKVE